MSKPIFKAALPKPLEKDLAQAISKELKNRHARQKKMQEKDMLYQPGKMSPINYLVLKVLHGQFDENSHPAIPIAIGMARKSLSQVKRLLSHGSL